LASAVIVLVSLRENKETTNKTTKDTAFRWGIIASILGIAVPSGVKFVMGGSEIVWGLVILALSIAVIMALIAERYIDDKKAIPIETAWFKTDAIFNAATVVICAILVVIYSVFW